MSGGSYNYLCHKSACDLLSGDGMNDLLNMRNRLTQLGYADAAKETDKLYQEIEHAQLVLENRLTHMFPVFHAVEWQDSCDTSAEETKETIEEWRKVK
jgi:hypothetical protein